MICKVWSQSSLRVTWDHTAGPSPRFRPAESDQAAQAQPPRSEHTAGWIWHAWRLRTSGQQKESVRNTSNFYKGCAASSLRPHVTDDTGYDLCPQLFRTLSFFWLRFWDEEWFYFGAHEVQLLVFPLTSAWEGTKHFLFSSSHYSSIYHRQ